MIKNEFVKVKFMRATPKFIYYIQTKHGKKLVEVGPFMENDEVFLPVRIANILFKKQRVTIIK